jgi:hypothetical protein
MFIEAEASCSCCVRRKQSHVITLQVPKKEETKAHSMKLVCSSSSQGAPPPFDGSCSVIGANRLMLNVSLVGRHSTQSESSMDDRTKEFVRNSLYVWHGRASFEMHLAWPRPTQSVNDRCNSIELMVFTKFKSSRFESSWKRKLLL